MNKILLKALTYCKAPEDTGLKYTMNFGTIESVIRFSKN